MLKKREEPWNNHQPSGQRGIVSHYRKLIKIVDKKTNTINGSTISTTNVWQHRLHYLRAKNSYMFIYQTLTEHS